MKNLKKLLFVSLTALVVTSAHAQFYPIPSGAVPFGNSQRSLTHSSADFQWDNTDKQLLVGVTSTAAKPAYSFVGTGNDDNGMWRSGTDQVSLTTAGIDAIQIGSTQQVAITTGSASAPALTVKGDLNTGINFPAADTMAFGVNGANVAVATAAQLAVVTGTAAAPSRAFIGDLDTGSYSPAANMMSVSTAGTERVRVGSDGNVFFGAGSNATVVAQVDGGFALKPPSNVLVTADNQAVTVANRSYIRLQSDNGTSTNRTITLSNGVADGQMLLLSVSANNVEIVDGGNVDLVSTTAWTPDGGDTLLLMWDNPASTWREVTRSNN